MNFLKKNWVYILFGVSVLFFVYKRFIYKPHNQVKVQTFQTSAGWGYDITVNDSVLIHQDVIPGIQGKQGFTNRTDAAKVGNLVLEKIKNKQIPTVSLKELDSLHINK